MNRFTNKAREIGRNIRSKYYGAAGTATALVAVSPAAFAGDLATAFTTEATAAKAELLLIGALVLTVCGVMFLIKKSQRATGG